MTQHFNWSVALLLTVVFGAPVSGQTSAAPQRPTELVNGDFEELTEGIPAGWAFPPGEDPRGYRYSVVSEDVRSGQHCVLVDTTKVDASTGQFAALNQSLDATELQGQRVRFRAAVRVEDSTNNGRAQLWLRVDRQQQEGQPRAMGAFDNMQNRPIQDSEWEHYEIVVDVDDDAATMVLGMLVLGNAKAYIDDVSLEVIEKDEPKVTTQLSTGGVEDAGPQPFFVWWLWLVVVGFLLFAISHTKPTIPQRYALRFSFVYWLLYYLPAPFNSLTATVGRLIPATAEALSKPFALYGEYSDKLIRWTGANVLKIEGELVAPNGSGDTTHAYIRLLICFVIALSTALIWSCADWRKTEHRHLKDMLRSFLRYTLAAIMLGYGLAKLGTVTNQFPPPNVDRLMKTYGDSSPMNLVWTFMGASKAYTMFAGLGEVVAAVLLVWRRTTILGACVAFGVMLNVMMLNFCYDVPVKQYSAHLLVTALFITLPDARRLINLLLLNKGARKADLRPSYTGDMTIWFHRVIKIGLIGSLIVMPTYRHWELEHDMQSAVETPDWFGSYVVEHFERDGEPVEVDSTDSLRWKSLGLRRYPWGPAGIREPTSYVQIRMMNGSGAGGAITVGGDPPVLALTTPSPIVPEKIHVTVIDEDHLTATGQVGESEIRVSLRRQKREDFLLINRGFRWINEYPYNR